MNQAQPLQRVEHRRKRSVHTFSEKPRFEEAYISGGLMVCDYKVFDYLKADPTIMFERQPLADLGNRLRFDRPVLVVPREMRELAFQAIDFQWEQREQ